MPDQALLQMTLAVAVPRAIEDLRRLPWDQVEAVAAKSSDVIASQGDIILYRSKKKGETAKAFTALAFGLAALSFVPGGVKFLGDHWISEHPDNPG